ncbi:hypothetical protein AB0J86_19785 [Micromonospora sp. NPDC049559]|uniref:hypothetical protein n=1 Tax=Micromonospora sp. NPDC049559 TaxID=3155923 RepID=UPI00343302F4
MESPTARPRTVGVAGGLWITLGVLLAVAGALTAFQALGNGELTMVLAGVLVGGLGAAFWASGVSLRRGRDTRVVLTVLGGLLSLFVWPALLAVPAIVLQYRASSRRWFDSRRSID